MKTYFKVKKNISYTVGCRAVFKTNTVSSVMTVSHIYYAFYCLFFILSLSPPVTQTSRTVAFLLQPYHTHTHTIYTHTKIQSVFLFPSSTLFTHTHSAPSALAPFGPLACVCMSNRISSPVRRTPAVAAYNVLHTVSARWRITELDQ